MSALRLVAAYLNQRARLRLFVPLSIVLALAGRSLIASALQPVRPIVIAAFEALGLVLALRIWDDLEDRDIDRVRHPERVVASASSITPLQLLAIAFAIAAVVPILSAPFALRRLAAIAIAATLLSVWYGARSEGRHHALGEFVLAMKYPLIAYATAPELPGALLTPRIVAILTVLYALICVYEYLDDVEVRHSFTSRRSVS